MAELFNPINNIESGFYAENVAPEQRGTCVSLHDQYGERIIKSRLGDTKVLDANFAFLSNALAKLHELPYEPLTFTSYANDIPVDVGGGFVDYAEYYEVNYAGIMNEFKNVVGNNANFVPRVNAGMTQKKVDVYTFEIAYDLRFIELKKMEKLRLNKSIEEIYKNAIMAGWDFFVQKVAYTGQAGKTGLFNSSKVYKATIDNSAATAGDSGFIGMTDAAVVSFFNGVFEYYLLNSNMNTNILPDTFLVPTFVGKDLSSRFSVLYTATLRSFLLEHNLGYDESDIPTKITIASRTDLNTLGTGSHGRIVAYKKDKKFVRLDMPYPMQHFITLPNIEKMSYTSVFVGQVSEIELPYNSAATELGIVSYWDFTK